MFKMFALVMTSLMLAACGHGSKKGCGSCGMHEGGMHGEHGGMHGGKHAEHGGKCADGGKCDHKGPMAGMPTQGSATLNPLGKSKVSGTVQLAADGSDVKVTYNLKGLKKNQSHGFHIHEFGDCTAADGSSAGGHFNPTSAPHGGPGAAAKHVGDLGNITADATGVASGETKLSGANLHHLAGRSFMVHAGADDLTSQPAGNSGDRVACGVIGVTR